MILSIQFRTILKIISHYFQNQSSPLKKTKALWIRSPRIGQNNAEIGLAAGLPQRDSKRRRAPTPTPATPLPERCNHSRPATGRLRSTPRPALTPPPPRLPPLLLTA